jgi:hypothetical protein
LFDDIEEDMDSEEAAISTSTPGFHMGTEPETAA